ncbi:MAG: molybdenum ABC transporter ATP-binding protein [Emcibacter sp.]|nr:molybdenum ABC transporter ATP-binding protein [Emcibacter sp.]
MTTSDITIKFNNSSIDLDVCFPLPTRGISGLFGPSGSGKTTLIRCLAGLEKSSRAHICIDGNLWQSEDIFLPPHKRRVGLVFQDVRLFDHLNVKGNLLFGYNRTPPSDRKITIEDDMKILALEPLLDKPPEKLSGGEAQRVAIGRALLTSPALLLMDEPLAALGEQHKKEILSYLKKLPKKFGIPILYVSHDFEEMATLSQYIICMENGKIQARGSALEVASQLPHIMDDWAPDNFIEGEICGTKHDQFKLPDGQLITIPPKFPASSPVRITINARDISLLRHPPEHHAGDALLKGRVKEIIKIQDEKNIIKISLAEQDVHVVLGLCGAEKPWLCPGSDVYMMINRIKLVQD